MTKPLVYFLCTGNSCRSQIADGFLRAMGGERYEVRSAGLEAHGLNPRAVQVMEEAGVDISTHTSDVIDSELLNRADYVITLCGHADEHCLSFNAKRSSNGIGVLMIRLRPKERKKK